MAETTIVNTPARSDDGLAGVVGALIVLAVLVLVGMLWYRFYGNPVPAQTPAQNSGTNINVTVPTPGTGGGAGGNAGGAEAAY